MHTNSFRSCTAVCLFGLFSHVLTTACQGEILYDNLQDDLDPFSYELTLGGTLSWEDDGLRFVSSNVAGVAIITDDGQLPEADAWSFRARFTINDIVGLGLAGVVVEHPTRWAGVFAASHDEEYGVGQGFNPQKVKVPDGDIFGDPFVVQLDYSADALIGHFWRPDEPTDVTKIEYSQRFSTVEGAPRFANNGTDTTYHAIWISRSPLPLPTGFEEQGDLNGNEILEVGDIDLLAEQIRGEGLVDFDLNGDGVVDLADQSTLVEDYIGVPIGDADLSGAVQFADFLALSENFGGAGGWQHGDFDADGLVGFSDFLKLAENFEQPATAMAAASVPEPSGSLLAAFGIFGLIGLRRLCSASLRIPLTTQSVYRPSSAFAQSAL